MLDYVSSSGSTVISHCGGTCSARWPHRRFLLSRYLLLGDILDVITEAHCHPALCWYFLKRSALTAGFYCRLDVAPFAQRRSSTWVATILVQTSLRLHALCSSISATGMSGSSLTSLHHHTSSSRSRRLYSVQDRSIQGDSGPPSPPSRGPNTMRALQHCHNSPTCISFKLLETTQLCYYLYHRVSLR